MNLLLALLLQAQPNVVVMIVDDLGFAQHDVNIDSICSQGKTFTNHRAAPLCTAGRYGPITGSQIESWGLGFDALDPTLGSRTAVIPATKVTLPEMFRAAGYRTRIVGKWHLGGDPDYVPGACGPLDQGFEHGWWNTYPQNVPLLQRYDDCVKIVEIPNSEVASSAAVTYKRAMMHAETQKALEYIHEDDSRPLFLWWGTSSVHPKVWPELPKLPGESDMDATLRQLGEAIAEVYAALPPDTLVYIYSDNGSMQHAMNAPLRGGKGTYWEGGLRTLGCLVGLDLTPEVLGQPVDGTDFYATILGAVGLTQPSGHPITGHNLWPWLHGQAGYVPKESAWTGTLYQWPLAFSGGKLWNLVNDSSQESPITDPVMLAAMKARLKVVLPSPSPN